MELRRHSAGVQRRIGGAGVARTVREPDRDRDFLAPHVRRPRQARGLRRGDERPPAEDALGVGHAIAVVAAEALVDGLDGLLGRAAHARHPASIRWYSIDGTTGAPALTTRGHRLDSAAVARYQPRTVSERWEAANGGGADGDASGLRRRDFIRRSAVAGGALAGMSGFPGIVREVYGEPIPVPTAARSVEAGLAAFAARWQGAGPAVKLTRFGDFLSDKTFNCRVAGSPRSYVLVLGTAGAALSPGTDPQRHADMVMAEDDWLGVLYGDYSGFAALMYGECFPPRPGAHHPRPPRIG